jgi:signal transduction histidine kinase
MLYEFMTARRDEILGRCLADLRNQYPQYSDADLIGELPTFFNHFIAALEHEDLQTWLPQSVAAQHATLRKDQGFDESRLVHDLGLLCDKTTEVGSLHSQTFTAREFQILNGCIDDAMAKVVVCFSEQAETARWTEYRERKEQLASLAHEMRNALGNAMSGFDLIRHGRVAANGSMADVVHRALSRIAALLPDIVAETYLHGKLNLKPEQLELSAFLAQLSAEAFPERGIRIRLDIPQGLSVDADARLLTSALTNIIQNAIKFTRDNGTVTLRANQDENAISIEIEDMCGGLQEASEDDLFKPFVQRHSDRRGMGLGLAIARRAVEEHDGHIAIRNLPGLGCVVQIVLPSKP